MCECVYVWYAALDIEMDNLLGVLLSEKKLLKYAFTNQETGIEYFGNLFNVAFLIV